MKLQHNKRNGQYSLNLPLALVKALGWEKGVEFDISIDENKGLLVTQKK